MSFRRHHHLAWCFIILALVGQLLAPVVRAATQARLAAPPPVRANTLSRVDIAERLRELTHLSVAEIRARVTDHDSGSKKLCQLTASLANATASALPTGFVATALLRIAPPLPRAHGVPVEGHDVEGLHPLSTGPPA